MCGRQAAGRHRRIVGKKKIHTRYNLKDGKRVPGATTIGGIMDKPAMLPAAVKLTRAGMDYKKVWEEKADIGTLTHSMILAHLKQIELDLSDYTPNQVSVAENCFLSYLEWERVTYKDKPMYAIRIEEPMVSEEDGFGGTPDIITEEDSKLILTDFKTGTGIYEEHYIQMAAYDRLCEVNGYDIDKYRILHIPREESESYTEIWTGDLSLYWEIFECCFTIYQTRKLIKRGKK